MKKTIYTLFLCSLFVFCFMEILSFSYKTDANYDLFGEKNAFRIERKIDFDGRIEIKYSFPLNSEFLKSELNRVEFENYKFYLTSYINELIKMNKNKDVENVKVGNCTYFKHIDGLGFSIFFENSNIENDFFEVSDKPDHSAKNVKVEGLFFKKLYINSKFPINSEKSAESLKLLCKMAVINCAENNDIVDEKKKNILRKIDGAVYIYDFSSARNGLLSENMYYENGFYHNVFIKSFADIKNDNSITFWIFYVNKPLWYLMAICVTFVVMVLYYFYSVKKYKIKT